MSKFMYNIGDTVEITPYLQRYTDIQPHNKTEIYALKKDVTRGMVQFAGKTAVVKARNDSYYIGYKLDVDYEYHKWHQDLLMPVKRRASVEEML